MGFLGTSLLLFLYLRCPPKWDGWQCWERGGRPGYTEYVECPEYIYFKTSTLESGSGNCKGKIQSNCYRNGKFFLISKSLSFHAFSYYLQQYTPSMQKKNVLAKEIGKKEKGGQRMEKGWKKNGQIIKHAGRQR